jgi:two-component system chemotaxis response regulator CheY
MKRMLLIDDSRAVRMAAGRIIARLGFEILEAENGVDALRVVRENPDIDAILLDWNMPVMDGITFLRELKADKTLAQPPVVMCTTENDVPRIMEALQAGASEYVMKPFTEDILKDKLEGAGII